MSMLSSKINNLRLMARLVRDYDYSEISRMLRDAADTIEGLRERLQDDVLRGECEITASSTVGLCTDNPKHWFKLSCGHSFTVDGLGKPVACAVCGKAVRR